MTSHAAMTARTRAAWAGLAEVEVLGGLQVLLRSESPLALPGSTGILRLDGTVTVVVPRAELLAAATCVVQRVAPAGSSRHTISDALARDLGVAEVVAQASLFFGWQLPSQRTTRRVVLGAVSDAEQLLTSVSPEEADESSLREVTSGVSLIQNDRGLLVAASGYLHWPSAVAHMCVLTHPEHRGKGHATSAAADAVTRALHEGLLPQWRARPEASKGVARALGLTELGEQVSIRLHE